MLEVRLSLGPRAPLGNRTQNARVGCARAVHQDLAPRHMHPRPPAVAKRTRVSFDSDLPVPTEALITRGGGPVQSCVRGK